MVQQKQKGKRKTQDPCEVCFMHKSRCICEFIPTLDLKTKVSLIIHYKELKRTTNTGTLALRALINSQIFIRGQINQPLDFSSELYSNFRDRKSVV